MSDNKPIDFDEARSSSTESPGQSSSVPNKPTRKRVRGGVRIVLALVLALFQLFIGIAVFTMSLGGTEPPEADVVTLSKGFDSEAFAATCGMLIGINIFSIVAILLALWAKRHRKGSVIIAIVLAIIASVFSSSSLFIPLKTYRLNGETTRQPFSTKSPTVVFNQILRDFGGSRRKLETDYMLSVTRNRYVNVLLPERLVDEEMINDARTRVQSITEDYEVFVSSFLDAQQKSEQSVLLEDLMGAERIHVRQLLKQLHNETSKLRVQIWEYERAKLRETLAVLDFMKSLIGKCYAEDGIIYFYDDEDVLVYNAYIRFIEGMSQEQVRMINLLDEYAETVAQHLSSGQLPDRFPAIPVSASANFTVSIDCKQVIINDQPIHLPATLETFVSILGNEYRIAGDEPHTWVWDKLGIMIYKSEHAEQIDSVVLLLRPYDEEIFPREPFVGSITMFNREFTRLDSPITFNRPRENWLFFPLDEAGTLWRTPDDDLVTWIRMNNDGLMGHIDVSPIPEVDEDGGDEVPY